ncbi:MAG: HD family hydrolase [Thermoprotei archaeon]
MKLYEIVKALDSLVRSGWMIRGIPGSIGETVSQHMYTASLIALVISEEMRNRGYSVDPYRAASLAIVHDLAEAVIGDIIPFYSPNKNDIEKDVVEKRFRSSVIKSLYREYVEQKTLEARIARLSDYLATYIKAKIYQELGYKVDDILANSFEKAKSIAHDLGISDLIEDIKEI